MLHLNVNDDKQYDAAFKQGKWTVNDSDVHLETAASPDGLLTVMLNGKSHTAIVDSVDAKAKQVKVRIDGVPYSIQIEEPLDRLLKSMGIDATAGAKAEPVKAPMPGMILKVLVEPGQAIQKGDGLLILEAMKMENVLKATAPGVVKAVKAVERTAVEKGTVLIEME